jgi:hypothetical protein
VIRRNREFNTFNLSMLDTICGAAGAFRALVVLMLPHYRADAAQADTTQKVRDLTSQLAQAVRDRQQLEQEVGAARQQTRDLEQQLGLQLAGKRIVFVVDTSGSMQPDMNEFGEDRLTQVQMGVKLLVATMGPEYSVDVVVFPAKNGTAGDFSAIWGELRPVTEERKQEVYAFISRLRADGATPTAAAVLHALANYAEATQVVLLSDGEPTKAGPNGSEKYSSPELERIVQDLTRANSSSKQLTTIGIGPAFRRLDLRDPAVGFMRALATRNGGRFYGF